MFRFLLLAAFIPALALAQGPVTACSGGRPMPQLVIIEGCSTAPCTFIEGQAMNVVVHFTAATGALSLQVDLWLVVGGFHVLYELSPYLQNGCLHLGGGVTCPLAIGQSAIFNFQYIAPTNFPITSANLEASLINHAGDTVSCFNLPATIVPANSVTN